MPGNVLSQLPTAKSLFASIDLLAITKHRQRHYIGAGINQGNYLIFATIR